MPTISYMTLVDKYQVASLIYLVLCCIWHATLSDLPLEPDVKVLADKIVLIVFACLYLMIQLVTATSIFLSYRKLDEFKKLDKKLLDSIAAEDSDEDC